jgi:hypothetical protein
MLVQERKAVEVPCGLNQITENLAQIAKKDADAAIIISKKLWAIFRGRNVSSEHPRTAMKNCIQELDSSFITKMADKFDNPSSEDAHLSRNIQLTLQQLYNTGILRTHKFAAVVDAVYYCMNEWLDEFVNESVSDLLIETPYLYNNMHYVDSY